MDSRQSQKERWKREESVVRECVNKNENGVVFEPEVVDVMESSAHCSNEAEVD